MPKRRHSTRRASASEVEEHLSTSTFASSASAAAAAATAAATVAAAAPAAAHRAKRVKLDARTQNHIDLLTAVPAIRDYKRRAGGRRGSVFVTQDMLIGTLGGQLGAGMQLKATEAASAATGGGGGGSDDAASPLASAPAPLPAFAMAPASFSFGGGGNDSSKTTATAATAAAPKAGGSAALFDAPRSDGAAPVDADVGEEPLGARKGRRHSA
jgi:hypothetical protein